MLGPGMSAAVEETVTDAMTAERLGSGDVPVLGTPALVALAEAAAVAAVRHELEPNETTVGVEVAVEHLAPTPVGGGVRVTATVTQVEGRRIRFEVAATDTAGDVARGTHVRVVVERDRFARTAAARLS